MANKWEQNWLPIESVTGDNTKEANSLAEHLSTIFINLRDDEHRVPENATTANRNLKKEDPEFLTTCDISEQSHKDDLPDWRSPIISSLCPLATGNRTSITRRPVHIDDVRLDRTRIEGEDESTNTGLDNN